MKAYIGMIICFILIYISHGMYGLVVCAGAMLAVLAAFFITIKIIKK